MSNDEQICACGHESAAHGPDTRSCDDCECDRFDEGGQE
jgi:hypothetical protein